MALPIVGRPPITIQRNAYGQPTRITDPGNTNAQDVTATYDSNTMLLRQVSNEKGQATQLYYDGNQNLTGVQTSLGSQNVNVNFGYSYSGALSSITNPLGIQVVAVNRENLERVTNMVDATGVSVSYQYDTLWPGIESDGPAPEFAGGVSLRQFRPGNRGRLSRRHKLLHLRSQNGLADQPDRYAGRTTRYDRDPKTGDILQTVQIVPGGANATTVTSYDRFGNLASVTPPQSSTITYNYDAGGRQIGNDYSGSGIPGPQ